MYGIRETYTDWVFVVMYCVGDLGRYSPSFDSQSSQWWPRRRILGLYPYMDWFVVHLYGFVGVVVDGAYGSWTVSVRRPVMIFFLADILLAGLLC